MVKVELTGWKSAGRAPERARARCASPYTVVCAHRDGPATGGPCAVLRAAEVNPKTCNASCPHSPPARTPLSTSPSRSPCAHARQGSVVVRSVLTSGVPFAAKSRAACATYLSRGTCSPREPCTAAAQTHRHHCQCGRRRRAASSGHLRHNQCPQSLH
jgi:hypothetical protein